MLDFLFWCCKFWCFVSYDEKVATETLLKKMDLKNYQVHTSCCLLFCRKLVKLLPALQIHNSDEIYYHIDCKFSWITFGNAKGMCTSGCSLVKPRYSWELDKWQNLMQRGLRCWVMLQRRFNGRFGHSLQEGIWLPCEKLLSRFKNTGEVWILCSTPWSLL